MIIKQSCGFSEPIGIYANDYDPFVFVSISITVCTAGSSTFEYHVNVTFPQKLEIMV